MRVEVHVTCSCQLASSQSTRITLLPQCIRAGLAVDPTTSLPKLELWCARSERRDRMLQLTLSLGSLQSSIWQEQCPRAAHFASTKPFRRRRCGHQIACRSASHDVALLERPGLRKRQDSSREQPQPMRWPASKQGDISQHNQVCAASAMAIAPPHGMLSMVARTQLSLRSHRLDSTFRLPQQCQRILVQRHVAACAGTPEVAGWAHRGVGSKRSPSHRERAAADCGDCAENAGRAQHV